MKKLFMLLLLVTTLFSCTKEEGFYYRGKIETIRHGIVFNGEKGDDFIYVDKNGYSPFVNFKDNKWIYTSGKEATPVEFSIIEKTEYIKLEATTGYNHKLFESSVISGCKDCIPYISYYEKKVTYEKVYY